MSLNLRRAVFNFFCLIFSRAEPNNFGWVMCFKRALHFIMQPVNAWDIYPLPEIFVLKLFNAEIKSSWFIHCHVGTRCRELIWLAINKMDEPARLRADRTRCETAVCYPEITWDWTNHKIHFTIKRIAWWISQGEVFTFYFSYTCTDLLREGKKKTLSEKWMALSPGGALTDVVVLLSDVELVAQRKGAVALELLWELDGRVGGVWPVALPPLEAQLGLTVPVAAVADHVEDVLLAGAHHARAVVVVGAVDVQVVVDVDLHRVALPAQTGQHETQSRKGSKQWSHAV